LPRNKPSRNSAEAEKIPDESLLSGFFGECTITGIIDFLMENRGFDYSKAEIAENAEIGIVT